MDSIKHNPNKTYMKSFFRVSLIPKMAIFVSLMLLFAGIYAEMINQYSVSRLEKVSIQLDLLYDSMKSISQQILADEDTFIMLTATETDPEKEAKAVQRLRSIVSGYPSVKAVGFYNAASRQYVSSACKNCPIASFCHNYFSDYIGESGFMGLRRYICPLLTGQLEEEVVVYTFVFAIHQPDEYLPSHMIVINLDAAYVYEILDQIRIVGQRQYVYITGADGGIVTAKFAEHTDHVFSTSDTIPELVSHDGLRPKLCRSFFITYTNAYRMGWYVVNKMSSVYFLGGLAPPIILALIMLTISTVLSYILSKRASATFYKSTLDIHAKADILEQNLMNIYKTACKKFTTYIQVEDIKSCKEELDNMLHSMNGVNFETAKSCLNHIGLSILKNLTVNFGNNAEAVCALISCQLEKIDKAQNINDLRLPMIDFFEETINQLTILRKSERGDAVTQVKNYIDKYFNDVNLSLNFLASQVKLTPAYVGQLFAIHVGMPFNDYLTRVRMIKAAEMLTETEDTVRKISSAVGIPNTTYFYALFKKQYNMTPSQYRESKRIFMTTKKD